MRPLVLLTLAVFLLLPLAGCLGGGPLDASTSGAVERLDPDTPPFLGYRPDPPDATLRLEEFALHLPGHDGVILHARIVKPAGPGPFPVITQFTPYTAPGRNAALMSVLEPIVGPDGSNFVQQFVRRGYAFAFADVRGTGDSTGCMDLRGQNDIDDAWYLTEFLGTQPWSNGKVGFIGASYPGSEAHIAGIANNAHLGAIVPVVASTSFYHYHHNAGVPYTNHRLGGTNMAYTQNALSPTVNPHHPTYLTRWVDEAQCGHVENAVVHGGLDQSGDYYAWWQERNLRPRAGQVHVPVLMAQGLADWNVKPDHIAHYYNDLRAPKTLIAGQWGHAYPQSAEEAYGAWWEYVTAFFDTHLKGVDTGMFERDVAWVQDTDGAWHRSQAWPLPAEQREELVLHLHPGALNATFPSAPDEASWLGCPRDQWNRGAARQVEHETIDCRDAPGQEVVFLSEPLERTYLASGVPTLHLTLASQARTHLVAVLDVVGPDGSLRQSRENYGYLNPIFRNGLDDAQPQPLNTPYTVTVHMYPQEDVLREGDRLRLTLRSHDAGRTIEYFEEGRNTLLLGPETENRLVLPLRPEALTGLRMGDLAAPGP